jgi:16S rRNA (uracil1498-N3)-methyltransferase
MHIFYDPEIASASPVFAMNTEESGHACRVLRLKQGDPIEILNGKGQRFICQITDANPKKCIVSIEEIIHEEIPEHIIHIAIAPTKNMDRIEWFAEKATELGVTHISLIECRNSERRAVKMERLEKVLISAMKQSKRSVLPLLSTMIKFNDFVTANPNGLIAHCHEGHRSFLFETLKEKNTILIGPEGDFSIEEVQFAVQHGYTPIHLGSNRLRTETAALYACMQATLMIEERKQGNV